MPNDDSSRPLSEVAASAYADFLRRAEESSGVSLDQLCRARPEIAERLRDMHETYRQVHRIVSPLPVRDLASGATRAVDAAGPAGKPAWRELLARLRARPAVEYVTRGRLGSGGMGLVEEVWDEDLARSMARKTLLPEARTEDGVCRFLEEARVTAQLDHPGICPVHAIGVDEDSGPYFLMHVVRGRPLAELFADVWRQADGWTVTRAVGVLLQVCETMSYAHAKGVVHRDLKPANVMVGRYGEVYVMDWGLARSVAAVPEEGSGVAGCTSERVRSIRRDESDGDGEDSPGITRVGAFVGTQYYSPYEQVRGDPSEVGPHSDVYGVGAMLYELLCGSPPYKWESSSGRTFLEAIAQGPPEPIERRSPGHPPELVSICERAMERRPADRYATMEALRDDLRAFLENRAVRAHRTGPFVELRKWCARNRAVAAAAAVVLATFVVASALVVQARGERAEASAWERDLYLAPALVASAEGLRAHPGELPDLDAWIGDARGVIARRAEGERRRAGLVEAALAAGRGRVAEGDREVGPELAHARSWQQTLRSILEKRRAQVRDPATAGGDRAEFAMSLEILPDEIEYWEERAERLGAVEAPGPVVELDRPEDRQRLARLDAFLGAIRELESIHLEQVLSRRELAASLRERTLRGPRPAWDAAIASIADPDQCPAYGGLELEPQLGLVPLRRDPDSGLWEFWHVASGERPTPDEAGRWIVGPRTGIVLVLLPGGSVRVGAQADDPGAPLYDPLARSPEKLLEAVLDPFFLSKYELTQGQYRRMTGRMPSYLVAGADLRRGPPVDASHPVERVPWTEFDAVLARFDLELPTEVQWEYGARGGSTDPYWWGSRFRDPDLPEEDDPEPWEAADVRAALAGGGERVNFADVCAGLTADARPPDAPRAWDGNAGHAGVGRFPANPFGLHEVLGNVAEYCRDPYADSCTSERTRPGTGLRDEAGGRLRSFRGGDYTSGPSHLRLAHRSKADPDAPDRHIGARPARRVRSRSEGPQEENR